MLNLDIAVLAAFIGQIGLAAVAILIIKRPEWFARFVSERFLIRHSLWDECDGEPMNVWAEEFVRRDERSAAIQSNASDTGSDHADQA